MDQVGFLPPNSNSDRPLSVGELTSRLKAFMERQFGDVFVEGEISNLRPAASGHVYFVLKDRFATINCVLWAADAASLTRPLREGETVEIRGRISLYEPRGQYQIIVSSLKPAGLGKLFLAFQELKERLQKEGLFEEGRKRRIPRLPRRVAVVTSPTGAAVRDIINVMTRRAPQIQILIYPVRVQGEGAGREIAHAIARLNALDAADVMIVGRGGGSLEDLWAFNEEIVARAIFASKIPVISAVGHEVDFTIGDFVADLRAPTPSAAAELVALHSGELLRELGHLNSRLLGSLRGRIQFLREAPHLRARLEGALLPRIELLRSHVRAFQTSHALRRPLERINELRQRLDDLGGRMTRSMADRTRGMEHHLQRLRAHLGALDPKAILGRGYSITFDPTEGRIIRSARQSGPGKPLRVVLHDGHLDAHVDGARPQPRRKVKVPAEVEWFGRRDKDE
ncbi:MAG: exodeoxyribonuclease VII large subunit [Candidatus Sumerlaeaceae bacterium]|nr:exodeoxyribonuclease VII large subunit [Candidatus Sumerlaeaceae bacterium]